jgi:hypothetical protein
VGFNGMLYNGRHTKKAKRAGDAKSELREYIRSSSVIPWSSISPFKESSMRLGVYVAAGPNPIFLRMLMLQIARQTRLPEVIAIFENGNKFPALDLVCTEITAELKSKGVQIIHKHETDSASYINRYYIPLNMLYHTEPGVDVFLKMDLDDFYSDEYVQNTGHMLEHHDLAINQNSGLVLVRPFHGDFKYKESAIMKHSPMGAAPTHVSFNRKFAEKYLGHLVGANLKGIETSDDDIMAEASQGMDFVRVDGPVDYMYVSHGNNQSSAGWQNTGGKIYFDK